MTSSAEKSLRLHTPIDPGASVCGCRVRISALATRASMPGNAPCLHLRGRGCRDPRDFERGGEFAAAVELRRRFPGISDNEQARRCARTIAGWKPLRF